VSLTVLDSSFGGAEVSVMSVTPTDQLGAPAQADTPQLDTAAATTDETTDS
jgi:hypothetical protein